MEHFIRAFGPLSVCNYVRSLGFEPEPALSMAGLELAEINRPGGKVPSAALFDLVEAASRVTGKPDFGLSWGMQTGFRRFGPLATFLANCESIRQTVTASEKFLARHNWGIKCQVVDMGELSRVEVELLPKGRLSSQQYLESLAAANLSLWKELLGEKWTPAEVWFHHKAQAPLEIYSKVFGCEVRFGMRANAIVARTLDLDRRETPPDRNVRTIVETMLVEELRCAELCFLDDVRAVLRSLIPAGRATIQATADALHLQPAALAGRLADNGQNLKSIVNETRLELIKVYTGRSGATSQDLQQLLGFRDTASLNRFVRQNMRRIRATTVLELVQPTARH
jgi:AraC-like DNA-binding protein